jgi:hypothetical protein
MSTSLCNASALALNPPATGLSGRLLKLYQQLRQAATHQRQADSLKHVGGNTLCDINAPDWLRREVLHNAEMEHYDRMRTMSQFRGIL